jgi:hypothetical protein
MQLEAAKTLSGILSHNYLIQPQQFFVYIPLFLHYS